MLLQYSKFPICALTPEIAFVNRDLLLFCLSEYASQRRETRYHLGAMFTH